MWPAACIKARPRDNKPEPVHCLKQQAYSLQRTYVMSMIVDCNTISICTVRLSASSLRIPVPEVVEEEAGLPAPVPVGLVGRPDGALAQAVHAPVQDEQQRDDAQPERSPPHP